MSGRLALAVALALTACTVGPARAHERNDRELKLLERLPRAAVGPLLRAGLPDASGRCPGHGGAWRHVVHQRAALPALLDAAARGDEVQGEAAWTAVEAAFARQRADGAFAGGESLTPVEDAGATALWLGDLAHALIVLDGSPLRGWFGRRIEALLPRVRLAADRLLANADALYGRDRRSASRLLADAAAFSFAGELDHGEPLLEQGRRFLDAALALQDPAGALRENGRADAAAQAASVLRLHRWALTFADSLNDPPLERGARWIATRVPANGAVRLAGSPRLADPLLGGEPAARTEIALALLLAGLDGRPGDPAVFEAGRRAAAFAARGR